MELVTMGVGQMGGYNRDSSQQPKFNERNQIMKMWFQGLPCYNRASSLSGFGLIMHMNHVWSGCISAMLYS